MKRRSMPVEPALFGFCFCLIFVACTSTGVGTGMSPTGNMTASFTWEQAEPTSGTLTATVVQPDGTQQQYEGKYYQITRNSRMETITDLWQPWGVELGRLAVLGTGALRVLHHALHRAGRSQPRRSRGTAHALPLPPVALRRGNERRCSGRVSTTLRRYHPGGDSAVLRSPAPRRTGLAVRRGRSLDALWREHETGPLVPRSRGDCT